MKPAPSDNVLHPDSSVADARLAATDAGVRLNPLVR